jgi:broad specificity phosphatase PhoE
MRLILIRHGQTISNVHGVLDTRIPGPVLTDLGRTQASLLPSALQGERIGAIYVSTMVRTHETAAPLAHALGLEPIERDGIREIAAADLEMRGDAEAVAEYLGTMVRWVGGEDALPLAGGETGRARARAARFDAVVAEAEASGHGTVAIVSHGAAIRSWTGMRARGLDAAFVADHALENTGVVVLEGSGTDWTLESWEGEPASGVGEDAPSGPTGEPTA